MGTLNKIEYEDLKNKATQINELSNRVEETFNKIDQLISENVNSGRGIWDGDNARQYNDEWEKIKEDIPNTISIFRIQAENIEKFLLENSIDE